MTDDLRLLALLEPIDPTLPALPLHEELQAASNQLAADVLNGGLAILLPADQRARLVSLTFALMRWSDRAEALAELARPKTRRERRGWWRRITWRFA